MCQPVFLKQRRAHKLFGEVEEVLSNVFIPSTFRNAIFQNALENIKQNVYIKAYTQFPLRDTGHSAQTDNPLINYVLAKI